MLKDFKRVYDGPIQCLLVTTDSKSLFIGGKQGSLVQISIETNALLKNYGKIYDSEIVSMQVTANSHYLLAVPDEDTEIKKISVQKMVVLKDSVPCKVGGIIERSSITADSNNLWVVSGKQLILISLKDGQVLERCDRAHFRDITSMVQTNGNTFLFTATGKGELKQWSAKESKRKEREE
jgi:hypothetical protein